MEICGETMGKMCVLVGTYRPENADWIRRKKLYNLPLPSAADPAVYRKFTVAVLYAGDAAPLAYKVTFREVVDRAWLKANGYSLVKAPHGERYALFALGARTSAAKALSDPQAEVCVCSSRWTGIIDADFYSRPLPLCGGKSIPNIFEKIRPYFTKWKAACAFNPVLRIQGFQDEFKIVVNYGKIKHQTGNSVAVPVIRAVAEKVVAKLKEI